MPACRISLRSSQRRGALLLALFGAAGLAYGRARSLDAAELDRSTRYHAVDIASFTDAAKAAERSGDDETAREMYRRVLLCDPLNDRAYESLQRLSSSVLQKQSPAYEEARGLLPPMFVEYESQRYVVLSDASPQWTIEQLERLERAHHQFNRFARRLDLRPLPLQHKLVCVLFEDRDAYRSFAKQQDNVTEPWIAGYYSPRHDRVVFYNIDSTPGVTEARAKLSDLEREMSEATRRANEARRNGHSEQAEQLNRMQDQYRSLLRSEQHRVDAFAEQVSCATTLHEAVHQLMFHTGVQSPFVQYPLWINEGLATAFEADDPNAAFGPDHEYEPRRTEFGELLEQDVLLPLDELVTATSMPDKDSLTVRVVYHQSYALVTWMQRFRRDELRSYILDMITHNERQLSAPEHLQIFESHFGAVDELERAWLGYEQHRSP